MLRISVIHLFTPSILIPLAHNAKLTGAKNDQEIIVAAERSLSVIEGAVSTMTPGEHIQANAYVVTLKLAIEVLKMKAVFVNQIKELESKVNEQQIVNKKTDERLKKLELMLREKMADEID